MKLFLFILIVFIAIFFIYKRFKYLEVKKKQILGLDKTNKDKQKYK